MNTEKNQSKTIAYLHLSGYDLYLEEAKKELLFQFARDKQFEDVVFIEEKKSRKTSWKNKKGKISEILNGLNEGDNLLLYQFSHMGRSITDCIELLHFLSQKKINLYIVKGNLELDESCYSQIPDEIFLLLLEARKEIAKYNKELLEARKKSGRKFKKPFGIRRSKLDEFREEIEQLIANGSTITFISKRYNVADSTVHTWLKARKILKVKLGK